MANPKWEVEDYVEIAAENGYKISHTLETHNDAEGFFGIETHHVREPHPAAGLPDERSALPAGSASTEPPQAEVPFTCYGNDPLHHRHRLRREQPASLDLSSVQV
ncbi:MAG: hypothetical protein WA982_00655 [Rubrobacteraceae bacterium]